MKLYQLILVVFGFSAWMVMLNAMGVFTTALPAESDTTVNSMNASKITELTASNKAESGNPLGFIPGALGMLGAAVSIIISTTTVLFNFPALLRSYGIPEAFTTMLMAMIGVVTVYGVLKLITNRSDKGME